MPALRWTGITDAGRMTLILKRKVGTHDWSFRVSMSLLGICIVDSWLLFTGAEGNRRHMNRRTFYEVLVTPLVDNTYDKVNLRRRGRQEEDSSSKVRPRIYLERTDQKSRKFGRHIYPYASQKLCRICRKNKTAHSCSRCRDVNESFVCLCNTSTGRNCFVQHIWDVHKWILAVQNPKTHARRSFLHVKWPPQLRQNGASIEAKRWAT